jgi:glycosyltransferase 2 family protein
MSRIRMWLIRGWKPALALGILALIARHFIRILSRPELNPYPFALRLELLVVAGLLYLAAHCSWAWFWVRLLRSQDVPVRFVDGLRAYFVSQFGKYIPGKVAVLAIRIALLHRQVGGKPLAVGITATYETLTSMGAGALVGILLLPWVGVMPTELADNLALVAAIAALPAVLGVLNKLAARRIARLRGPDAPPLPSPPLNLLAQGLLHGAAGWCLLGISLGLAVQAVANDPPPWTVDSYLGNLGAVALAYVAGFFVLVAPGGLGVREVILQYALMPRFEPALGQSLAAAQAAVIALVLRLTWTIAELAMIAGLLLGHRKTTKGNESAP